MVWGTGFLIISLLPILSKGGPAAWNAHGGKAAEQLSYFLDQAPTYNSLQVTSDHWLFPLWYRQIVEGRRPDIEIVGQGLLPAHWYQKQLFHRYILLPFSRERLFEQTASSNFLGAPAYSDEIRNRFIKTCQTIKEKEDPFLIQKSLCSQIILTWTSQMVRQGKVMEAIHSLELLHNLPSIDFVCMNPNSINLPFPLFRDFQERFLFDPFQPQNDLMLLYLGCHQNNLAEKLFQHTRDHKSLDSFLLYAFLLWQKGEKPKAIDLLESYPPKNRQEKKVLDLAIRELIGNDMS